jgi:hypothetical protein
MPIQDASNERTLSDLVDVGRAEARRHERRGRLLEPRKNGVIGSRISEA